MPPPPPEPPPELVGEVLLRVPPELLPELVGEVLLRVPPDEPADLFRAAAVCKPWRRILSDRAFLRRYRELHRTPPFLGFFPWRVPTVAASPALAAPALGSDEWEVIFDYPPQGKEDIVPLFVPTVAASPALAAPALGSDDWEWKWDVIDCRHNRVLVYDFRSGFIVWDPITGDHQLVPETLTYGFYVSTAAVLCAVDRCDHLDCHGGHYRVFVVVGTTNEYGDAVWVCMYSSETAAWSIVSPTIHLDVELQEWNLGTVLVGDALYFRDGIRRFLKYDLGGRSLSVIDSPPEMHNHEDRGTVMAAEDGGSFGFAAVLQNSVHLWSWKKDGDDEGNGGWVKHRVIELETLLPTRNPTGWCAVVGYAEGTDTIFLHTDGGAVFTLQLKAGTVKKVGQVKAYCYNHLVPYMSFYAPAVNAMRLLPSP